MIWVQVVLLAATVVLLVLTVVAFAAVPASGRHRAPIVGQRWAARWAASLGEGWVLYMDGTAEYIPHGRRTIR